MFEAGKTANFICRHCRARFREQLRSTRVSSFSSGSRQHATHENFPDTKNANNVPVSPSRRTSLKNEAIFYPLGKIRGSPGKSVREKSANLETQSLGRPSEVIILHDVTNDNQEKVPELLINEAKSHRILDSKEIVASIEAEKLQLGLDDAVSEIDGLRPRTNLSQKAFEEMRNQLRDGYTIPQLRRYIAVKAPEISKRKVLSERNIERNNILNPSIDVKGVRSLWLADTKPIEQRLPLKDTARARLLAYKRSSKTKLADLVILGSWKVEIEDDIEAFGQIEMKLRPWQTNLLLSGDPSILDQIRDRRNVRIDVWRLSIIRVSGYKRSAEETLNDIDNELLSMNELDFDTLPFKSLLQGNNENLFSEEQIGIVARVTQSVISQFPDRNKICIRAIGRNNIDNAYRFLLYLLRLPTFGKCTVDIDAGFSRKGVIQTSSEFFIGNRDYGSSKTLRGRYVSPVSRKGSLRSNFDNNLLPIDLTKMNEFKAFDRLNELLSVQAPSSEVLSSKEDRMWKAYPGSEISVKVGQLLHSISRKRAFQRYDLQKLLQKPDVDRQFVDAIPNTKEFLSSADLGEVIHEQGKLMCYFVPSPWTEIGVRTLKEYPRIAMCFGEHIEGGKFQLLDIFAIDDEVRADIMLPQHNFDIRFLRQRILHLHERHFKDPNIENYASSVESMALDGAQIQAPTQLSLRVPIRLQSQRAANTEYERAENELIPYTLSSIEHHQRTSALVERLKLSYTAIEAGQIQGSFGELKLHMPTGAENFNTKDFIAESLHVLQTIQDNARRIRKKKLTV